MDYTLKGASRLRRDTDANWKAVNPVLADGEQIAIKMTDGSIRYKIGNGSSDYNSLKYFVDQNYIDSKETIRDSNSKKPISFSVGGIDGDNFVVEITGGGDSTSLVESFNGRSGDVVPQSGDYTASDVGAIPTSDKGKAGGVATLGSDGKVPTSQLPKADAPFKPEGKSYLTFSSPNSFTLKVNDTTKHWDGTLEYFASNKIWTTWDGTTTLSSVDNDGEYVLYLRGTGNTVITGSRSNYRWVLTGSDIACIGNIENLLDYTTVASGDHPTMASNCYRYMFQDCTSLTQAPSLPATILKNKCYFAMFYNCTSLAQAPTLPATMLADYCYFAMFYNCTSLTQAPALPATTLAQHCYNQMFAACTNLTQAPSLPATTLAEECYNSMFEGCTSLTQAPALPATTLRGSCYNSMFYSCTALTQAPTLPATTLETGCYFAMFYGCTSLTKAPTLPATTLADDCYNRMFYGCTSLKLSSTKTGEYTQKYCIPTIGTGTSASNALTNMFSSTGGTFTGTPEINTTYYLSSDNMVVRETEVATLREYVESMIDGVTPSTLGLDKSALLKSVEAALPASAEWLSVTFGNGRFVAISYDSNIAAYSYDGITWTQSTLPDSKSWTSVTFGNGRFVAVAEGSDIVAYSYNGITWKQTTLYYSYAWKSVTFGNGRFVAISYDSNIAVYSDDGINWTQTTLPASATWQLVTFGNNRFVAVANFSNIAAYSYDGITWTQSTLPASAEWLSVTFGNGRFVAIANSSNIAAYSDDGIIWTQTTLPVTKYWCSVTFGNNRFVAIARNYTISSYSDDGITWYNTIDVLTYPDNTDIKDRVKSVLGIVSMKEVNSAIQTAIGNAIGGSY